MDLKGKVAIVTGAGRGLGWGIAERLANDGASLVVAEIDPKAGEEKAGVLSRRGREALFVKVDVSRWTDVENMAKKNYGEIRSDRYPRQQRRADGELLPRDRLSGR